jgi:purine-binding chemotaxis protein CheW
MRRAFDRIFAAPLPAEAPPCDDFLSIQAGPDSYALRLTEVAGLYADRTVVPLPATATGFRGIASFRGVVVPVYDLAALLGYPREENPRWLVLVARAPIGLAFNRVDGHLRVPRHLVAAEGGPVRSLHVQGVVHEAGLARPVIDLASVCDEVRKSAKPRIST